MLVPKLFILFHGCSTVTSYSFTKFGNVRNDRINNPLITNECPKATITTRTKTPISQGFSLGTSKLFAVRGEDEFTIQTNEMEEEFYFEDEEEDDDDEGDCGIKELFGAKKNIFIISDNYGNTAKMVLQSSLAQFGSCDDRYVYDNEDDCDGNMDEKKPCNVETRIFTFIQNVEDLSTIINSAHESDAMVIFTFADPFLRQKTQELCRVLNVQGLDLLDEALMQLSEFLGKKPIGLPLSRLRDRLPLSKKYFNRIEAVEFTLQADDGQAPWLLKDADIILVGVSRTGKTPLSVMLSQTQGLKVANIPLVLECPVPKELLASNIDPQRVFCLTIAPTELKRIRKTRLERRNVKAVENDRSGSDLAEAKSNYSERAYVLNDLKNARMLATKQGWTEIDVTGRAVEESSSFICELLAERFGTQLKNPNY